MRMTTIRKCAIGVGALLLSTTGIAGGTAAMASSPAVDSNRQIELAAMAQQADERGYLIVTPSDAESVDGATFYPTGPIADDTLLVISDSDGSLPNGLTTAALDSLVAQQRAGTMTSSTYSVPAGESAESRTADNGASTSATSYAWAADSSGYSQGFQGGSLIGWNDEAEASYYFYTAAGYNQRASGEGLGYYRGYNGSEMGTWSQYYYVGTASSTGAGGTTPWGNVAANRMFRAICTQTVSCFGNFE